MGLLCTGQIARHFGLPFRTGGAMTSSQVPDAQAGYEALMTLLPTFLAGASRAFDAHVEVGQGGHFRGAMHTMERFRTCFYRPMLSSSENYEKWMRGGGVDAAGRAEQIYQKKLVEYEPPALDDALQAELEEYVVRRRAELGD